MKATVTLSILLLMCTLAKAQRTPVKIFALKEISLSYTGFNSIWQAGIAKGKHQVYGGPKLSLNYTYLPTRPVGGFQTGYRYAYIEGNGIKSFIAADYQLFFLKPYNPHGIAGNKKNSVQEITISLGAEKRIFGSLSATVSMGIGKYKETYHDLLMSEQNSYRGYNGIIKGGLLYAF